MKEPLATWNAVLDTCPTLQDVIDVWTANQGMLKKLPTATLIDFTAAKDRVKMALARR